MPWCDHCSRFLSPSTVAVDGTCPSCGREVDPGGAHAPGEPAPGTDDALPPIPWHAKALAGAVAVYLGYRTLPLLEWIARRL